MTPVVEDASVLEPFGYTTRQAQFLALVALHGGYFLRRQFVAFTGRTHGLATVRFLDRAVARGDVRSLPYGSQGRVFHLCARPLYAALGEEHNRNQRVAEWAAVTRKLMALDFVLAHPDARFWATETDKVRVLQEHSVPQELWPAHGYAPTRRPGVRPTTRYFVDKMPWYGSAGDPRLWIAYVDAEVTLRGFERFLGQYRGLLGAVPSGVTYVGAAAWPGAVQRAFDKVIVNREVGNYDVVSFLDYCRMQRCVEANDFAALHVDDLRRYRWLKVRFVPVAFQALYRRWRDAPDVPVTFADLYTAARPDCVLRVHALGDRYELARRTKESHRG
jgi:hypothetical protein